MKPLKDQLIVILEVNKNNNPKMWLIGYNKFMYRDIEDEVRVMGKPTYRNEVRIINKENFNKIKSNKLMGKAIFPYNKEFEDLELFEI